MTPKQTDAAWQLQEALKACASAKLAVFIYDACPMVCPTIAMKDPRWSDDAIEICESHGKHLFIPGLVCDGGAGC